MTLVDVPFSVRDAAYTVKQFIKQLQSEFDPNLHSTELNEQYDVVSHYTQRQIDVERVE